MKNLILRTLTGVLFVALLVGCIIGGSYSFAILFAAITGLALWEFGTVVNNHDGASVCGRLNIPTGLFLFATIFNMAGGTVKISLSDSFAWVVILFLLLLICELYRKAANPLKNWAYAFASQIYITLPFSLLSVLAFNAGQTGSTYNYIVPLAIFIFLWTSDTGAYCCGSLLHKYIPAKLFPRISPNKSWVGSIGGGLLCIAAGLIMWKSFGLWTAPVWIGFALVVCVFGTLGDLVESMLKRQLNIKDSGHILPGHGGILDRFDSALLAIPATLAYFCLIELM